MRTKEFTFNKGWAGFPNLTGQTVTWQNGATIEEALAPNPTHPENKPDFPSVDVLLAYAYAQLDIRRGHAVRAEADAAREGDAEKGVAGRDLTLEEAQAIARATTATSATRRKGSGVTAAAKKAAQAAKPEALSEHSEGKLRALLELEMISQSVFDAEMARRSGGESKPKAARRTQ